MKMYVVTEPEKIADAYEALARRLTAGGEPREANIASQTGKEPVTVHWHPQQGMWVFLEPNRLENRFSCAYGLDEPGTKNKLTIACEINIQRQTPNRQVVGAFARDADDSDKVHLIHSGKMSGGAAGSGKFAFVDSYKGNFWNIFWEPRTKFEYIVIGSVTDDDLLEKMASFVRQVADFKAKGATEKQLATSAR